MPTIADHPKLTGTTAQGLDWKAIAAHGIGRGDFAALVFSGSTRAIGEAAGYCTWSTARKFALPDPRVPAEDDLARGPHGPLPLWSNDRVRPTPGVCFVFADEDHPAIDTFRARGGEEFEHFVVLSRLTADDLLLWRVRPFLEAARGRPIALLGFGDQGSRFASLLVDRGVDPGRVHIVDDRSERQVAAANAGFTVASIDDAVVAQAAVIATPLVGVSQFEAAVGCARADGRPALDNSLALDGRSEFVRRGCVHLTAAVDRCVTIDGSVVRIADNGLEIGLAVIEAASVSMGGVVCPALRTASVVVRSHEDGLVELGSIGGPSPTGLRAAGSRRWFVGLAGQSNHVDAALGIFAAREFLRGLFPEAVAALMPAEHRGALGATPFEALVPRTCTGRSLGSPFMSAMEQATIGVLARHYAGCGASGCSIIEIGSALGGSALLMAAATQGASAADGPAIISIDPDAPTRPAMRAVFEVEGYASRLAQIVATSDDAVAEASRIGGGAGLVFIDGLHTADAAARDLANYAPLVRRGGCVVFHDCDSRHAGVFQTVARIAATDPRLRLVCMVGTLAVFERRT